MNGYDLIYFCKQTGEKFLVKRIMRTNYRIMNPDSGTSKEISYYMLRKKFTPCASNMENRTSKSRNKLFRPRSIKNTKAFKNYLDGVS